MADPSTGAKTSGVGMLIICKNEDTRLRVEKVFGVEPTTFDSESTDSSTQITPVAEQVPSRATDGMPPNTFSENELLKKLENLNKSCREVVLYLTQVNDESVAAPEVHTRERRDTSNVIGAVKHIKKERRQLRKERRDFEEDRKRSFLDLRAIQQALSLELERSREDRRKFEEERKRALSNLSEELRRAQDDRKSFQEQLKFWAGSSEICDGDIVQPMGSART